MVDSALLIAGILLWCGAHLFKRLAPTVRKQMGNRGKGLVALVLLAGIVLIVLGYRGVDRIDLWYPPRWLIYLNNLTVLVAIYMLSPAPRKGLLLNGIRHPMLIGFLLLVGAHLLVNGDLASIFLFGALGIWSVLEIAVINRAETKLAPGRKRDDCAGWLVLCSIGYPVGGHRLYPRPHRAITFPDIRSHNEQLDCCL